MAVTGYIKKDSFARKTLAMKLKPKIAWIAERKVGTISKAF